MFYYTLNKNDVEKPGKLNCPGIVLLWRQTGLRYGRLRSKLKHNSPGEWKSVLYTLQNWTEKETAQWESKVFQLNFYCLQFNQCESSPTLYDPVLTMKDARALEEILTNSPTSFHFGDRAESSVRLTETQVVLQSPTVSTTHQAHSHHHPHHQVLQQLSPNNLPNSHNNGMFDNGNNVYNLNVQVWIDQIFFQCIKF